MRKLPKMANSEKLTAELTNYEKILREHYSEFELAQLKRDQKNLYEKLGPVTALVVTGRTDTNGVKKQKLDLSKKESVDKNSTGEQN